MAEGRSSDLSASNKKLSLIVLPQHDDYFVPGESVHGRAVLPDVSAFTEVELALKVTSWAAIMGKDRWQYAQLSAGGLGNPQALVTSLEEHTIFEYQQTLWPQQDGKGPKAKFDSCSGSHTELSFDIELPTHQPPCACDPSVHPQPVPMPSSVAPHDLMMDFSRIYVRYKLSLKGKRSGFFHKDAKLTVELPVASSPADLPRYVPSETNLPISRAPLRFKGAEEGLALQARMELPDIADGIVRSPCEIAVVISWSLISTTGGEPPSSSLLEAIQPSVEIAFSRYPATRPVDNANIGKALEWPNQRVTTGKGEVLPPGGKSEERQFKGALEVPDYCVSFETCGARVDYRVHARISSKDHIAGGITLSLPLIISHARV